MIKVGIESDVAELYNQLSAYPERYFFIFITEGRPALCIQTCDSCGNDILVQEVDGLEPDSEGNLFSTFNGDLHDAIIKRELFTRYLDGERYPLSHALRDKLIESPGLLNWIIASARAKGRCLMIYPSWCI